MSSYFVSEAAMAVVNSGMYYANAKVFEVASPKGAAIYSAVNSLTRAAIVEAFVIGSFYFSVSAVNNAEKIGPDPYVDLILRGLFVSGVTVGGTALGLAIGRIAGIFAGKQAAATWEHPLTYKQIVVLGAIHFAEATALKQALSNGN